MTASALAERIILQISFLAKGLGESGPRFAGQAGSYFGLGKRSVITTHGIGVIYVQSVKFD
jgi:hypothetical protein